MMGNMQINPTQMAQFQALQQQRQLAARQVCSFCKNLTLVVAND